jgi:hypothetical protein
MRYFARNLYDKRLTQLLAMADAEPDATLKQLFRELAKSFSDPIMVRYRIAEEIERRSAPAHLRDGIRHQRICAGLPRDVEAVAAKPGRITGPGGGCMPRGDEDDEG